MLVVVQKNGGRCAIERSWTCSRRVIGVHYNASSRAADRRYIGLVCNRTVVDMQQKSNRRASER